MAHTISRHQCRSIAADRSLDTMRPRHEYRCIATADIIQLMPFTQPSEHMASGLRTRLGKRRCRTPLNPLGRVVAYADTGQRAAPEELLSPSRPASTDSAASGVVNVLLLEPLVNSWTISPNTGRKSPLAIPKKCGGSWLTCRHGYRGLASSFIDRPPP